jgi:hypothetical protein
MRHHTATRAEPFDCHGALSFALTILESNDAPALRFRFNVFLTKSIESLSANASTEGFLRCVMADNARIVLSDAFAKKELSRR